MKSIFISYSRPDLEFCKALTTHLRVLQSQGLISTWHDQELAPGAAWQSVIDEKLHDADIIIMLVSVDFLNSHYCNEGELNVALKRWAMKEVTIIPVIVRHCDWQATTLGSLQALPSGARPVRQWPDQDEAWADVTRQIRAIARTAQRTAPAQPPAPRPSGQPAAQALAAAPTGRGLVLENRSKYENFAARFAAAESIDIQARSMHGLVASYLGFLVKKARAGCKLRLLLLDPRSPTVETVAGLTQAKDFLRQDIERTFAALERVLEHKNAKLRLTSVPAAFSLVIADRESARGWAGVELYAYDVPSIDRPHFELSAAADKNWYEFFADQFERLWQDARPHEPFDTLIEESTEPMPFSALDEMLSLATPSYEEKPRPAGAGSRQRVDRESFLASCTPEGSALFTYVLDEAIQRGHHIYWGTSGFSAGALLPGTEERWSFAYGYPPDDFQFYFQEGAPWSTAGEAAAFRKTLLQTGIFREAGRLTLKAHVDSATSARSHAAARLIFERVEESIRAAGSSKPT